MKKRVISEGLKAGGQRSLVSKDTKCLAKFPSIMCHLADVVYDDGSPRQTGSLTIRALGQSIQITARDPDAAAQIQALGTTIDDALMLLDRLLGAEDAPWEIDRFAVGTKKRK